MRLFLVLSVCLWGLNTLLGCARPAARSAVEIGAKSAPPARSTQYTIHSKERVDEGERKRLRAKVIIPADLDVDRAIDAIRGAIHELLPADGEIQAVEVLAYRAESEVQGDFTFARAYAAKDGKGWDGRGWFQLSSGRVADRSNIELELRKGSDLEHHTVAR